jgi:hypothetical protein
MGFISVVIVAFATALVPASFAVATFFVENIEQPHDRSFRKNENGQVKHTFMLVKIKC